MSIARPPSGTSNLASEAVRNLLASLAGSELGQQQRQQPIAGKLYPQLGDLLRTSVTVPVIESLGEAEIDNLISFLPPKLIILHAARHDLVPLEILEHTGKVSAGDSIVEESLELLGPELKRDLVVQVLRSPMFLQSLQTISRAISEGGLPSIAEALGIEVENGGRIRGGAAPLGGGDALEAFVNGVKKAVQKKD